MTPYTPLAMIFAIWALGVYVGHVKEWPLMAGVAMTLVFFLACVCWLWWFAFGDIKQ